MQMGLVSTSRHLVFVYLKLFVYMHLCYCLMENNWFAPPDPRHRLPIYVVAFLKNLNL